MLNHLNELVLIAGLAFTFGLLLCYFKYLRSRPIISFLPNIWTSLGILGTFAAIVRSLGDCDDLTNLPQIIEQITPAFVTSIIGIIGAIATSLTVKFIFAKEDKKYDEENRRKSVSKDMSPELLLDSICQAINRTNSRIDGLAKKISEGILAEVDQHLVAKMEELATDHTARLIHIFEHEDRCIASALSEVKSRIESAVQDTASLTRQISERFGQSLYAIETQVIELLSKDLADRYRQIQDDLTRQTAANVSAIHEGIYAQVRQQMEEMRSNIEQLSISIGQSLSEVTANLAAATATMSTTATDYQEITECTADIKKSFISLESALSDCIDKLASHSSSLESLMSKNKELHDLNYKLSYEVTQLKKTKAEEMKVLPDGSYECPNCRTANPPEANFCRNCRHKFVNF